MKQLTTFIFFIIAISAQCQNTPTDTIDREPPQWPKIKTMTVNDAGQLVLSWEKSASDDVVSYEILIHEYDTTHLDQDWDTTTISTLFDVTQCVVDSFFCQNDISSHNIYTVSARDTAFNNSLLGLLTYDYQVISPPYFEEITFDGCKTLFLKWNKFKSIGEKTFSYFLEYQNEKGKGTIPIPNDIAISGKNSQTAELDIFNYYTQLGNQLTIFRILTTNNTDTSFSCYKEQYISTISTPPDYSIINSVTVENNATTMRLQADKNTESKITYCLSKLYNNTIDTIFYQNSCQLNDDKIIFEDTTTIDNYVIYNLTALDSCMMPFPDSSYVSTLFLEYEKNEQVPSEISLSCNPLFTNKEGEIEYILTRVYGDDIEETDVTNFITENLEIKYNINFIVESSFYPVEIWIDALIDEEIISHSNTVIYNILEIELKMPNAFIPDSENEINTRFGPMNLFSEKDIKEYVLEIYNNMGQRVWWTNEYSSYNNGNNDISRWNGYDKNGNKSLGGTYVYYISIKLNDQSRPPIQQKGIVTLINK